MDREFIAVYPDTGEFLMDLLREALEIILEDKLAWNKDGSPALSFIQQAIGAYVDWAWMNEVFIPLSNHVMSLFRAFSPNKDEHFIWDPNLWDQDVGGWFVQPCSEECPAEQKYLYLQEEILDRRCQIIYNTADRWQINQYPSAEMVMKIAEELKLKPTVVKQLGLDI